MYKRVSVTGSNASPISSIPQLSPSLSLSYSLQSSLRRGQYNLAKNGSWSSFLELVLAVSCYHQYKQHCIRALDHQLLYTHAISFLLCSSPLQPLPPTATVTTSPLWYICFSTDYSCLLFGLVVTEN
ncbi:unnamed protein product [Hymenolepis diminuta]|uniref:Uncharacterized protein n=1 Tax=Hymenolepis diminuta TaxID=6216 RepID=A0A564XZQ5_HYMDI|nr:unnamed protein product [Hymenolepis diminuta]